MFCSMRNVFPRLCENSLNIIVVKKRLAGHSKWQNIRHIKGAKDAERAALFTRISRQIRIAIQEGGSADPKFNLKLEQVVQQAKRANMPVANIQSAIKNSQQDKAQGKRHLVDIIGPGSCFIICEVYTNNLLNVKMGMATILRKHNSKFADGGCMHLFEEKGIIEVEFTSEKSDSEDVILERATDHAIEAGAEDVTLISDNVLQFTCDKLNLNQVVQGLEQLKYKVASASVEYIPLRLHNLQENDLQLCQNLCNKLENLPEVVRLSDNVA